MKPVDFVLWSDMRKQPDFESYKARIAKATGIEASEIRFEAMAGRRISHRAVCLDECKKLCNQEAGNEFLMGHPLMDIRVIAT